MTRHPRHLRDSRRSPKIAGLCLGGLLLVPACKAPSRPVEAARPSATLLNHDPSVPYVGKEACRSCHTGNFTGFAQTGMGRSFYPMTPDKAIEDWDRNNEFVDEATGLHYRMLERDGRFYQRQFLLDSRMNRPSMISVWSHRSSDCCSAAATPRAKASWSA